MAKTDHLGKGREGKGREDLPEVRKTDKTGAIGVTIVQLAVEAKLGWIFRRLEHRDTGLDAEVEVVLGSEASGLLLGLQIKSGRSQFRERSKSGWKYRGDYEHLRYWQSHNLTVLVVLVDVDKGVAYWNSVDGNAEIHEADNSWTLEVPKRNVVRAACKQAWMNLAWAGHPRDALYRYCAIHAKYIELLANGGAVGVDVEEWINKTRGQASFEVISKANGHDEEVRGFGFVAGIHDPVEFLKGLFPWADVEIDEDYYEIHEDVEPDAIFQDDEAPNGYVVFEGERRVGEVRPYENSVGEVDRYRFRLSLNDIGQAYAALGEAARNLKVYPPYDIARRVARVMGQR